MSRSPQRRLRIFYVLGVVQSLSVYILADSGYARNLISKAMFNRLTYKPTLRPTEDIRVIEGNGDYLVIDGFALLPASIGTVVFWHEFGVCPMLLLDCIIGVEVLYCISVRYTTRVATGDALDFKMA